MRIAWSSFMESLAYVASEDARQLLFGTFDRLELLKVVAHPCKLPYLVSVTLLNNLETILLPLSQTRWQGVQTCEAASSLYSLCRSCIGEA